MKILNKNSVLASIATTLILSTPVAFASHPQTIEISLTNISNVVFTPPVFALCKKKMMPIATVGETASVSLENLAEAGDTAPLIALFTENNCSIVSHSAPIASGETIIIELTGNKKDFLHFAAMLLPTNDGFIYSSGQRVKKIKKKGPLMLTAYDAGTELNDEICANIPGPMCNGEGFNSEREDNDFVKPHAGIHGFADIFAKDYSWGEPVAYIKVK
jgi:hypothetical protein